MTTTDSPSQAHAEVTPEQTLRAVAKAEVRRLLSKGGVPIPVIVAGTLALTTGILTMFVMKSLAPEPARIMTTTPVELGAFIGALVLSVAAVFAVGRDHAGQLGLALSLTPNRSRLFMARTMSWVALTAVVIAICTTVLAALGFVLSEGRFAGSGLLSVAVAVPGSASMVLIAVALAHLVGRAFGSVLLLVGVNLLLPLGVFAVGTMIPAQAAEAVDFLLNVTPTPLFIRAVGATTIEELGPGHLLLGQFGLVLWALVLTGLAHAVFRRRTI
ncbi:hypothetical protein ACIPWF_20250 [Paenarthrobacter sp. NPDC089989]|uniref:hypothetical protein n=1 Tax=unclassified Paenarthrobacter TaxID=2634190 RepID=UPI0037FDBBF0